MKTKLTIPFWKLRGALSQLAQCDLEEIPDREIVRSCNCNDYENKPPTDMPMKSQEDTHCRNWRAVFLLLFCTVPRVLHAQMPPGGGWSWPTNLNSWSFGDTNTWQSDKGHEPISSTNIVGSEQGDISVGYSMVMDSTNPARLQFNLIESDGSTNLTLAAGTVFLWFNPDWASSSTNQSGTGPGVWGRLIDVGSYTTNANFGWWSLYLDSGG